MVQINNKGYRLTLEGQVALGDGNTQESVSTWTFSICILQEPISVSDQNTANTRYYAVTNVLSLRKNLRAFMLTNSELSTVAN